jgi:hypothetical protein
LTKPIELPALRRLIEKMSQANTEDSAARPV